MSPEPVDFAAALAAHLLGPAPHRLELGAGWTARPGWLATDLAGDPDAGIWPLDATAPFPIADGRFDYAYAEHMIEHVEFPAAERMLAECRRILKPGGVLRIVTPSLGFLLRLLQPDRGPLEDAYRDWSVRTFVPEAPTVTDAFFLNNFMRAWHHMFIYDRATLRLALERAGFTGIVECALLESAHVALRGLETEDRLPPGFLALESMVFEATRPPGR
jgi:predicted SAM-dependent methyltransferase